MQLTLPRLGNQRQKQARARVIKQLAQQAAERRGLNRFSKLGQGRGPRAANPFVGAGGRFGNQKGLGRPSLLANRGMGRFGEMLEIPPSVPAIHVQPAAPLPVDSLTAAGPLEVGGVPQVVTPDSQLPSWGEATGQDPALGFHYPVEGPLDIEPFVQSWGSPSGQGTIAGLIPLGQGMYLNPTTGEVMGVGLANRGLQQAL
jgi:hypothetical protein